MNRRKLNRIVAAIATRDTTAIVVSIDAALRGERGIHWRRDLLKLRQSAIDGTPRFSIFGKGNGKLPFVTFSGLPGAGFCPGAGDCLNWCYSFRAWRYPAAFCRQAQGTMLLDSEAGREQIRSALAKIAKNPITLRLYVDGDYRSIADVAFWQSAIAAHPAITVYGYSKSFSELLAYRDEGGVFAPNYLLNVSGGHRHDSATVSAVERLPIARGHFVGVSIGRKVKTSDHGTRPVNAALRAAYGRKAFTCPGKCGSCLPSGDHACGSARFRGVDVIIAVH